MPKVYVGMCVHRGMRADVFNLTRVLERCPEPVFEFQVLSGDALIDRSRSRMATHFLTVRKDCDILLFLDDDILYDPKSIRSMVTSMVKNDMDIIGGTYVTKNMFKPKFTYRGLDDKDDFSFGKSGYIVEIKYLSTGCMAIKRRVLEKISESNLIHFCHPDTYRFFPFFMPMEKVLKDGRWTYLSEDWAFCERAKQLGFKVWLDTTVKLKHIGDYKYDWDDMFREEKKEFEDIVYKTDIQKE